MKYVPHKYQERATRFVIDTPKCALFLDMGLGKSVIALTAIQQLIEDYLEVEKVLVIAPKSVARNTWTTEPAKWDHLKGLRVSLVAGTVRQREKALEADADIYVVGRDSTKWLVEWVNEQVPSVWPFDMVVVDESSSFKNWQSNRWKSLRSVCLDGKIRRMVLLTGTPSPNGLIDLWAQIALLDRGQRLGRTIGTYRTNYFKLGRHNGAIVYDWNPRPGAREQIIEKISDICLSMQAADYLELPDLIQAGTEVVLTEEEATGYREFEREQLMEVDDTEIQAVTAAALANKLLQYSGGAVYDVEHHWHMIGESKMAALENIMEFTDEPVLVYYAYQHELARLTVALAEYGPVLFRGEPDILERWNRGEIRVLLCHPASVSFGLNMQEGGHIIVWFTPTWNLEQYLQANARLHRQGQRRPVILYHLVAVGTLDERVMSALAGKTTCQEFIMQRIKQIKNGENYA